MASIIEQSRVKAIRSVDHFRVRMYWELGRKIVEEEQQGKQRAEYGKFLVKKISQQLKLVYGSGFSKRQLEMARKLFCIYPIAQTLSAQLTWSHYVVFIAIDNQSSRLFYETETLKNHWSVRQLLRQVNSQLYERLLLGNNSEEVLAVANSEKYPVDAKELIKDPMVLEFLGLKADATYYERDLESKIITHLQEFLLELGNGFSFISGFEFLNHPVTCLRQASSFTGTFSAGSLVPPLLSIRFAHGRRGV